MSGFILSDGTGMFWPVSDHVYISVEKRAVRRAHRIKDCTTK